ncbi:inhibitor of nuclear factor kappa-B kinase-interacting protein isoform X2 [Salarias fasciatus]|uniref:IKBKB interacting protein n=1 Tax=Salarias fasciatus TaxID=181472 RepID=A0A672GBZ2_SALFA|nr:inhibitor of nuclear factor kappa-B kinase-interacting protein isoform X2 [Salarias fasciatus]
MPTEVKQRKKTPKVSDEVSETLNGKNEAQKTKPETGENAKKASSGLDFKSVMCLLSLAACGALSWMVLQHNEKFSQIEEKYKSLQGKTSRLLDMEEEIVRVSQKCESVRPLLEELGGRRGAARPQVEALERDVVRLKEFVSGLTEKQARLQSSMAALRDAVLQIQDRTSAITKDFTNKVASVRTDVRRMDGLRSELDSLLTQVGELEDKSAQVEHGMVKRIGDVLAGSIDRVANLRAASERNSEAIGQLRRRLPELAAADRQISDQLLQLESGRARLIRTVTFASDLKPKVATIRRDLGGLEPRLSDLTFRIGQLAGELMKREQEIAELRQTLANLTAVEGDLTVTSRQVSEIADLSDIEEIQRPA